MKQNVMATTETAPRDVQHPEHQAVTQPAPAAEEQENGLYDGYWLFGLLSHLFDPPEDTPTPPD